MTASQTTRVELDGAKVISAGSIRVDGFIVSNDTSGNVEAELVDSDGAAIMSVAVLANDSIVWSTSFMADNGLSISTLGTDEVSVTVAHSRIGA